MSPHQEPWLPARAPSSPWQGTRPAMAPETTIGAASPVGGQGEDLGTTEEAKVKNATAATARSLTERRGPTAVKPWLKIPSGMQRQFPPVKPFKPG